jgi:hypothetical protein
VTLLAVELTAAAAVLWAVTLVRGYRRGAGGCRSRWACSSPGGDRRRPPAIDTSAVSVITGLESALVVTLAGLGCWCRHTGRAYVVAIAVAGLLVLARFYGGDGIGGHLGDRGPADGGRGAQRRPARAPVGCATDPTRCR